MEYQQQRSRLRMKEFELKNAPSDGITAVKFSPNSTHFLIASSWDTYLHFYDVLNPAKYHKFRHNIYPIFDCAFKDGDDSVLFSGGMDGEVLLHDIEKFTISKIGTHEDSVRCLQYSADRSFLLSGGWDRMLKVWDLRSQDGPNNNFEFVSKHDQEHEIYSMSLQGDTLVVGTAQKRILIWDLRNMAEPLKNKESILRTQTRCVRVTVDRQNYLISSAGGQVAWQNFDNRSFPKDNYHFKCHKEKVGDTENLYSVNAISCHEKGGYFSTGGSDGTFSIWNGKNKSHICTSHKYDTSITSLDFNKSGNMLAVACSFLFDRDDVPDPIPKNQIFIRDLADPDSPIR